MKVKVIVESKDLSAEEVYQVLQAIRDCEQKHFPQKVISIWVEAPELPAAEAVVILSRVTPPFSWHWAFNREIVLQREGPKDA